MDLLDSIADEPKKQGQDIPAGDILDALDAEFEGAGVAVGELRPSRVEARREGMGMGERAAAGAYNLTRSFNAALLESAAAIPEVAGQIGEMAGLGGETLRGVAQSIRDIEGEYAPEFMAGGVPLVEPGLGSDVAGAVGSGLSFAAGGAISKGLGLSARVGAGLFGSTLQAQSMYRDAEAQGADDATKMMAFAAGAGIGASEAFGVGSILDRIDKRSGGQLQSRLMRFVAAGAKEAPEEAIQEFGQTFSEEAVARKILEYAEPEEWDAILDNAAKGGLIGSIVGFGLGGVGQVGSELPGGGDMARKLVGLSTKAEKAQQGAEAAQDADARDVLAKAGEYTSEEKRTQASPEEAVKRYAKSVDIEPGAFEVIEPGMDPAGEEVAAVREKHPKLVGLLQVLEDKGGAVPPVVVLEKGDPGRRAAYIDGVVVLDGSQEAQVVGELALHELLHGRVRAGSEAFKNLAGIAAEEFPALTMRMAELYAIDFQASTGKAPFASIQNPEARQAMLVEEGFAWGAENAAQLIEGIVSEDATITPALLEESKSWMARLWDWLRNLVGTGPAKQRKAAQALLDQYTSERILAISKPAELAKFANAIADVFRNVDTEVLEVAAKSPEFTFSALPVVEAVDEEPAPEVTAEDQAMAEAVDVEALQAEVDKEADQTPVKERKPAKKPAAAPKKPVRPDVDERLTPKQRKRLKQKQNRERKRQGKTEPPGPPRTYRRDANPTAAEDAIRRFEEGDERWAAAPTIEVDGVERPRINSEGRAIATTDDALRAFWRWFGESKVVDEAGRPLVVYHGTSADDDFTAFRVLDYGEPGIHFGGPDQARAFTETGGFRSSPRERAGRAKPGGRVIPAYLRILNPAPLTDAQSGWSIGRALSDMRDGGLISAKQHNALSSESARRSGTTRANPDGPGWVSNELGLPEVLERLGFDGFTYENRFEGDGGQAWAILDPTQIKSATGNRGTFSAEDPDIRWAAAPAEEGDIVPFESATMFQRARRYWQDEFEAVERVQQGAQVPEGGNVRRELRLYESRIMDEALRFREAEEARLKKILGDDLTVEDAHRYLWAKHAGERNAWIYKDNDEWHPETNPGSGMRSSVATKVVQEAERGPNAERYKKLSRLVRRVNRGRLRKLEAAGLLSPEFLEAIKAQGYQNYVPLKSQFKRGGMFGRPGTRRTEVGGQEGKKAKGRRSEPDNVLINMLADYESAIHSAHKAEIGRALLKLVETNPDKSLWQVYDAPPRIESSDDEDMGVMRQLWDMREDWQDKSVRVYNGGESKVVVFNKRGEDLARAIKRSSVEGVGPALRMIAPVTRYFAKINTSWNPAFIPVNFIRDIQTAAIVIGEEFGKKAALDVAKATPSAIRGIFRGELGKSTGWGEYWARMKAAGGKTSFYVGKSWDEIREDIAALEVSLKSDKAVHEKAWEWAKTAGEFVGTVNDAVENGVRLSYFKYAVETLGKSDAEAAELARTVTIDFNTRGEARWLSAMYMFANASIQGSVRVASTLMRSKTGRTVAASIAALGVMSDLLNYWLAPDDEDGENAWDAVPEWKKDRYWMIYTGTGENGFLTMPMPYGFSSIFTMGRNAASVSRHVGGDGGSTPLQAAADVASSAMTSFSPIGDAHNVSWGSAARMVAPTFMDPMVELATNEDYRGQPIRPEPLPFDTTPKPDSQMAWKSTPEVYKDAAALLNSLTGGSEFEKGAVDVSPNTLRYLVGTGFGGMLRTADRAVNSGATLFVEGDPVTAFNRAPFVRHFYTEEGERKGYYAYRDNSTEVLVKADAYDQYRKSDKPEHQERAKEMREEFGDVLDLAADVKRLEKIRKREQKRIDAMPDGEAKSKAEADLYAKIREFNRKYQEAKGQ